MHHFDRLFSVKLYIINLQLIIFYYYEFMNQQLIKQLIQEQLLIRLPNDHVIRGLWEKFDPLQKNTQIIIIQ